ncbi:hypothetical protein EKG40_08255 [Pseudomonas moorei]|nr:hypothetical protein EKG40_08255 [Pseudomonas moorei]
MTSDSDLLGDLFYGFAQPLHGSWLSDDELIRLTQEAYPSKPYCIVRNWMLLDVMLSERLRKEITVGGQQPVVLYAQNVVKDSGGRRQPDDSVCTSFQVFFDDCFFETKDTLFILAGRGSRKHTNLLAVAALKASLSASC